MNVLVWNEYSENQKSGKVKEVYPEGLHVEITNFLKQAGYNTDYALLEMPEDGLSEEKLNNTDVLIWWGHSLHNKVSDETVKRVTNRVYSGMGIIFLHSAHLSKPFLSLMGTTCSLKWREADENERLWVVDPTHEIAEGLNEKIEIDRDEMYGEYFDIPIPDELVFIGWFKGGEVFRSGVTYKRGLGKVFYFQPGHETYPVYKNKEIQKILVNAVKWAVPKGDFKKPVCSNTKPVETI